MKTKSLILFFLAACYVLAFSQSYDSETDKPYFRYGPKFGLNLNADLNNPPSNADDITSQLQGNYQIGGFLQMGKRLYFQPEFHYAVQKVPGENETTDTYEKFKIPVHIGLKFFDIGLISLHVSGGAMLTHNVGETFAFDPAKLEYQIGAGVDIFDFITTDLRYIFRQGESLADQISDFQENGGIINLTVGLKFK
jgi:hypothetical protein